jgi:hypothetical protein
VVFYPPDRDVPTSLHTDEFVLVPLTTEHVDLDYAALMASVEMLRTWSGTPWPEDDFTVDDNRQDLDRHDREHREREAFTFTVLTLDRTECLGCVYITPLGLLAEANPDLPAGMPDDAAVVGFWVTQPRQADRLDERLLGALRAWFQEAWSFPAVYFATREVNEQQLELFGSAGLERRWAVVVPGRNDHFVLHR